jgi:hypothetical protein
MTKQIEMGDPIILVDASGMQEHFLFTHCKGTANSVTIVEGDKTYINFQPAGVNKFYWMDAGRFILDEDAL